MSATALGVVAGVVVYATAGLHGLLVLTAAIVSWSIVRAACTWLLMQQKKEREAVKQHKTTSAGQQLSALRTLVVRRRRAIIVALLVLALAVTITGAVQHEISPLAAFSWLLLVLVPLGLVYVVFVQQGQECRRRKAEQQPEQEREEAAQRREAERRAEQQRHAEQRRRQAEQDREAERQRQDRQERVAKQLEEREWWSVLEVSRHADVADIRRAYHQKIKQCHPDRVAGLAPEFVELAEKHTRALNAAYDEATRACRPSQAA